MDHHGGVGDKALQEAVAKELADLGIGPTGKFPDGHLSASDEGETRIAIGVYKGQVVIDMGGPVRWLAMPPTKAIEFGRMLAKRAREVLRSQKK